MTAREKWQLGMAVLTAYLGPEENRAADINALVAGVDSRDVVFGVLAVAHDALRAWALESGVTEQDLLQSIAEAEAEEND